MIYFTNIFVTNSVLGLVLICWSFTCVSQETNEKDDVERIIVEGRGGNAAMRAFNAGDFELAEAEFEKNAKCSLRLELDRAAYADGIQNAELNQQNTIAANQGNLEFGHPLTATIDNVPSTNLFGGGARTDIENSQLDCANRGYQLYMMGMSQLKLGKINEAEKSFKSAIFADKNLYDAHYRIGLLHLLRDNNRAAKRQMKHIKKILKRCGKCESKNEMIAQVSFLEKALKGEIKLK